MGQGWASGGLKAARGWFRVLWGAALAFLEDEGDTIAGHLAFMSLLSLFPFIIFTTALIGFVAEPWHAELVINYLVDYMPEQVAQTLAPEVQSLVTNQRTELLTIGAATAIWIASSGLEAIRVSLNRAYKARETRPFWRTRIESIVFIVLISATLLVLVLVLVVAPVAGRIAERFIEIPAQAYEALAAARFVLAPLIVTIGLFVLHRVMPNRKIRWRDILPGALLTTFLWLTAAIIFSWYLESVANYATTYGGLGGIVASLFFFWISGAIFIYGAEVNGILADRRGNPAETREKISQAMVRD